jgi:flagellar hook-basal body complex protein FliE
MPTAILPIRSPSLPALQPLPVVKPQSSSPASSFTDLLSASVNTSEQATRNATEAAQKFLSGENEDLHTVTIAEEKAELTSELLLQVRNKAISAYQEIMKMQL